ncbi:MAG: methionyl-tRNA formyltransferase [Acidobacteria bacterium]|nr:methionyl-tRNA formyltransferase [Acidobacteriota bacterium]
MRIAFFGTPAFAVPTLEALLHSSHEVVLVVTQPDRPRGRGNRVSPGPVKLVALGHGLPVRQPEKLTRDPWEAELSRFDIDLGVVAAYGQILPDWLLALPRGGLVNVHASLLPRYRGASPIHRAVMNGDAETGVTIMRVVKALDAGPMLARVRVPIGPDDRTDEVEWHLARAGARLLVETVDRMGAGPVAEEAQNDADATYAPRLKKEEGLIDWARSARAIHNQVRALHPWPHAYTFGPGGRLILHRSRVGIGTNAAASGTIVTASAADGLQVATGDGVLDVIELQAEGGKVLPARTFLAGHALHPGDRLGNR